MAQTAGRHGVRDGTAPSRQRRPSACWPPRAAAAAPSAPPRSGQGAGRRVRQGARGGARGRPEDHPGERQPRRRSLGRHQRHRPQGQGDQRHGADLGRRRVRQPERRRQDLAQRAPAGRVAELHGDRHRHRRQRRQDHHDEHLPHPDARADVLHDDLRGVRPDLRRRHADHADVQHADHQQGGRRAVARAHHVQAGDRRLVLGRRRAPVLPAAGLLAGQHHGQLRRPPERGAGRQGRVRHRQPDPDVRHRPVADRRRQHDHPPHADLPQRQARLPVADQHRPPQPADPGRHLRERGEGQPGPHDRRRRARQRRLLRRAGQLRGPVHLQRRLLPLRSLVGRGPGHHERQPRLREPAARRRGDLLQHVHPRRSDHRHQQHGGGQMG